MTPDNRRLYRFAFLSASATFCLVIAGGLVTSTGSGMSVPTWPFAPNQLLPRLTGGVLFEYGHRMVAGAVLILTLILASWLFTRGTRPLKWLGSAAVLAVMLQAILGGITVLFELPPLISVAHAALAQAFFCIMSCIVLLTNPDFRKSNLVPFKRTPLFYALTLITPVALYIQILLGAIIRHTSAGLVIPDFPLTFGHIVPPLTDVTTPVILNFTHTRIVGSLASFFVIWASILALKTPSQNIRKTGIINLILLSWQLLLGAGIVWGSKAVIVTTAHVGTGALLLVTNVILALQVRLSDRQIEDRMPSGCPETRAQCSI